MRKFLCRIIAFLLLFLTIIAVLLFLIPNKKIENNSLFSNIDKHRRLDSIQIPKIVFVGGSSTAFGLNSQLIEDSLHMPVVNMGLHAGLGLEFMLSEVQRDINKGDIIVVAPEYEHFTGNMFRGEKVLVALLFDVNRKSLKSMKASHLMYLTPQIIEYAISKIFYKKLDVMEDGPADGYVKVFTRNSFNKYGDESMHWSYPNQIINTKSSAQTTAQLADKSFNILADFKSTTERNGAKVIIIPPALQNTQFQNLILTINKIDLTLKQNNISFSIPPVEFAYPDTMFFNTAYHLDKRGANLRTQRIIKLLKRGK